MRRCWLQVYVGRRCAKPAPDNSCKKHAGISRRQKNCEDCCELCEETCNHGKVVRKHERIQHEAAELGRCCECCSRNWVGSPQNRSTAATQLAKRWLARNYNSGAELWQLQAAPLSSCRLISTPVQSGVCSFSDIFSDYSETGGD